MAASDVLPVARDARLRLLHSAELKRAIELRHRLLQVLGRTGQGAACIVESPLRGGEGLMDHLRMRMCGAAWRLGGLARGRRRDRPAGCLVERTDCIVDGVRGRLFLAAGLVARQSYLNP